MIGLSSSLPLAAAWPFPTGLSESECTGDGQSAYFATQFSSWMPHIRLPVAPSCVSLHVFVQPVVWAGLIGAGIVFVLLAQRLTAYRANAWAAVPGGLVLLVAAYIGSELVPRIPNPDFFLPVFLMSGLAEPFATMVFGIALVFAITVGVTVRVRSVLWKALAAALITGLCYWLASWVLHGHLIMLWTHDPASPPIVNGLAGIGRPMGPMIKTVVISNFIAGTVGGAATLWLLGMKNGSREAESDKLGDAATRQ
ncbi:MAG: hypothetical protein ACM3MF_02970 [Anaerolineae bacterium]